jgi:thioesterase domain-containing protein
LRRTAIAHVRAVLDHQVTTEFDGDVLLVSCTQEATVDHAAQWAPVARRLRTRWLDCSHFEACTEPQLPALLGHINEFLDGLDRTHP